jgi:hypothetical protein
MTGENPRIMFLHYGGVGRTEDLAKALKSALDKDQAPAAHPMTGEWSGPDGTDQHATRKSVSARGLRESLENRITAPVRAPANPTMARGLRPQPERQRRPGNR